MNAGQSIFVASFPPESMHTRLEARYLVACRHAPPRHITGVGLAKHVDAPLALNETSRGSAIEIGKHVQDFDRLHCITPRRPVLVAPRLGTQSPPCAEAC